MKEASDAAGNIISVVPQFLFQLDGSSTAYNDSNGRVRFNNVSIGSHTVSEILTSNWTQQSVTPSGGIVQVQSGDSCAQITFRNRQTTLLPPPPSCGVDIEKSADRYEVQPGDIVSYTVTVRNTSQAVIRDLEVSDDLPSLVTVIDAGGGDQNGNELKRDTSEVEAGGLRTWTYRVRISSDARHGDIITNTAILESSCGTDRASATVRVLEELPQTGFGDFMKGSPYLTKIKASTSAAASGGSAIFLWLAGAMGAAATFVGGIKRFF